MTDNREGDEDELELQLSKLKVSGAWKAYIVGSSPCHLRLTTWIHSHGAIHEPNSSESSRVSKPRTIIDYVWDLYVHIISYIYDMRAGKPGMDHAGPYHTVHTNLQDEHRFLFYILVAGVFCMDRQRWWVWIREKNLPPMPFLIRLFRLPKMLEGAEDLRRDFQASYNSWFL